MKKTLSHYEVVNDIYNTYDHQFSWEASGALAEYYEELEEDTGEEIELDSVAICCDWGEYDDEELLSDYGYLVDADDPTNGCDEEDMVEAILDDLRDSTTVIELSSGYLVMHF